MDFGAIFGFAGNLTLLVTFLLPARMLYKIWNNQPGRSMVQYQYHAAIVTCALWLMYGQIHRDNFLVYINLIGFAIQICYLIVLIQTYYKGVSFSRTRLEMMKNYCKHLFVVSVELFSLYLLASLALSCHDPSKFSGTVCAVGITIIFILKMINEPKEEPSVYEPHVYEFVASFANGFIWAVYGLIISDTYILVPNMVGGAVGMYQLGQYVYRRRSPQVPQHQIAVQMTPAMISV